MIHYDDTHAASECYSSCSNSSCCNKQKTTAAVSYDSRGCHFYLP